LLEGNLLKLGGLAGKNVWLREVFADNPDYFTSRNNSLRAAGPDGNMNANGGLTDRDLAKMEKFMQKHKDIARELGWEGAAIPAAPQRFAAILR
jgi:hypothetical protein